MSFDILYFLLLGFVCDMSLISLRITSVRRFSVRITLMLLQYLSSFLDI